ncbi:MAG TPA: diacylglycerol kinase family protein [Bacteroidia bacterium]|nr:diacylglycerol kinase family protein [Bacteroidia bacterium]
MKKRIAFVINPKSGSDRKTDRVALIKSLLSDSYEATIFEWNKVEDRDEIFGKVVHGGFDIGVAVGGDGTVSQLASALSGSPVALGIIPFGSGNGLARHLGVPLDYPGAMKLLETGTVRAIDKGIVNGHDFFCTSGTGFDARIGKLFAESSKRGFWTYTKLTLREYANYSSERYEIRLDGKTIHRDAFLITTANAGQYGNDAWIAPEASVTDGQLRVVILKPFHWWNLAGIAAKMFRKKTHTSKFIETFTAKEIQIIRSEEGAAHHDGEPAELGAVLDIKVVPGCLRVIVNGNFKG